MLESRSAPLMLIFTLLDTPQSEYQIDLKAYKVLSDKVNKLPGELRFPSASEVAENGAKAFIYSDGAKMLYLDDRARHLKLSLEKLMLGLRKPPRWALKVSACSRSSV